MKQKHQIEVADTLSSAAGLLGVPLSAVKQAKRKGCTAFKNGRVHLPTLHRWLVKHAPKRSRPVRAMADAVAAIEPGTAKAGIAHAAQRLAEEEIKLHALMLASPMDDDVRRAWHGSIEQLRKLTAISDAGGGWIERHLVVNFLREFNAYLLINIVDKLRSASPQLVLLPDAPAVAKVLVPLADGVVRLAMSSFAACNKESQGAVAPELAKAVAVPK